MKLKDININAEDLLNFLNNHICTEETAQITNGFQVKFVYKLQLSQLTSFITEKSNDQIKNKVSDNLRESNFFLNNHKPSENEIIFRITGRDLKNTLDKTKDV